MANKYSRIIARICFCYLCGAAAMVLLTFIVRRHFEPSPPPPPSAAGRTQRRMVAKKNPLIVRPEPVKNEDMATIIEYQRLEEEWCRQRIANRSGVNWCPCVPRGLQGRVLVNKMDSNWTSVWESVGGSDVRMGGEWLPDSCVPHTRLAIIIPCRDRDSHLRILLRHLFPILKRQQLHFRVFVVDQRLPMIFNKAAIMNIGFLEAQKRFTFDCVVFHDVDMLLEDDRALMTCGPSPRHYARAVDRMRYSVYPTFGGVVSITPEMFLKVNGFALRFFGWGGEDDDMWGRIRTFWGIYSPTPAVSRYSTIYHTSDVRNHLNRRRFRFIGKHRISTNRTYFEGLSDLIYAVNSVQLTSLFTRIEADINITHLDYPLHQTCLYHRVRGACLDLDHIITSRGVSWETCRFQCDIYEKSPCFGFSYVQGKCNLIATVCQLVPLKNRWTFVKDAQFAQRRPTFKSAVSS